VKQIPSPATPNSNASTIPSTLVCRMQVYANYRAFGLDRWGLVAGTVDSPLERDNLVGRSPPWISALRQIVEMTSFTDGSILINRRKRHLQRALVPSDPQAESRINRRDQAQLVRDCEAGLCVCTSISTSVAPRPPIPSSLILCS